jgi:hypothetical protein
LRAFDGLRDGEVATRSQIKERLERARAKGNMLPFDQASGVALMTERHYTFNELASMWNLSYEKVRRLFVNERVPTSEAALPLLRESSSLFT